jgi:hypothetical protein
MNTHSDRLCENWVNAYFMRKKPAPVNQKRWQDSYNTLEHDNTKVRLYNSGFITFNGNIKSAAIAVAKFFLEDDSMTGLIHYLCIDVSLEKNKKYTIKWVGGGVIPDDTCPEPKFWKEFKTEFERYCELKVFL